MKNYIQTGDVVAFTAPAGGIASGEGRVFGNLFAVATAAAAEGARFTACLEGVFALPKATGAITEGQKVYWDSTAKKVTTTASGNKEIGSAISPAAADATTAEIRLSN